MKKSLIRAAFAASLLVPFALATPALAAAPNWDITGTWTFNDIWLGTPYVHTMVINSLDPVTGAFSGTGFYNANPALTWTVTGTESGNDITVFHLLVDTVAPGVTIDGTGTIDSSTSMSGTGIQSGLGSIVWTATGVATSLVDGDSDGVLNGDDLCPGTVTDVGTWSEDIGTNRWQLGNNNQWYQNKKKGGLTSGVYDIDDTYGCNGHQILTMLNEELGSVMNGHWKYGLSSSVLEEFHLDLSDGELDGMYLVDTVVVPANDADGVSSTVSLLNGYNYTLKASGTAMACNGGGCVISFDADYSTSDAGANWVDGVAAPYTSYGLDLLDLKVDGGFVNWGTYNSGHVYEIPYTGTGSAVSLFVNDVAGSHFNNSGNLTVDIYAQI